MRLALLGLLVACSSSGAPAPAPAPKTTADPAQSEAVTAQLERGKQLFADKCSECHGDAGQGTDDGPALVGTTALPKQPRAGAKRTAVFRTAADVFVFASRNMPADDRASLTADEYLAICAFALAANGVTLERPLDQTGAQAIVLHP